MQWSDVTAAPSAKTLRQFAALFLIVFVSLGGWRALHQRHASDMALVVLGLVVGGLGLVRPLAIRWIYRGWIIAAFPLGWTLSQIMLGGLFYLVFTPVAAVFRLMKRDALRLRRPGNAETYWRPKPGTADVRDYFRQF